jgi:hypothetical protein
MTDVSSSLENVSSKWEGLQTNSLLTPSGTIFLSTLGVSATKPDTPACLQAGLSDPGEEQEGAQVPKPHAGHEPA